MKKNMIKISAVAVCIFFSFTGIAQQAGTKPKVAEAAKTTEQDKTQLSPAGPQIAIATKIISEAEQPKAIVPGGEFKPVATDKLVVPNDKKQVTENYQPIISPVTKPVAESSVAKEQNAPGSNQQKPKPAPQVLKEQ
jgi:hypothetical protein